MHNKDQKPSSLFNTEDYYYCCVHMKFKAPHLSVHGHNGVFYIRFNLTYLHSKNTVLSTFHIAVIAGVL
jgi:hypothetical protein